MKKVITAAVLLSVTSLGFAAAPSLISTNNSGAYIGVGAGLGGMNTPKLSSADKALGNGSHSQKRLGFAARPYVGYLWAQNNWRYGVEAGYSYYQENKYTWNTGASKSTLKYNGYSVDLLGVAKYVFANNVNVFGKAGAAYTHQKTKFTDNMGSSIGSFSKKENKILPEVACGAGYDFNKNFGMDVSVAHIFGHNPKNLSKANRRADLTRMADVNTVMLGFTYHFA